MEFNDFLNPKSMITPGAAGGLIMILTNTLWVQFALPQNWTALILSYMLAWFVVNRYSVTFIEKALYIIFNGLIIFSLAASANFAGQKTMSFVNHSQMDVEDGDVSSVSEKTPVNIQKTLLNVVPQLDNNEYTQKKNVSNYLSASSEITSVAKGGVTASSRVFFNDWFK